MGQIYRIFDADTIPQASQRYDAVLALRPDYVQALPEASVIFDFLQRHWPKLAKSIGSDTIPATNNTVELVTLTPAAQAQVFIASTNRPVLLRL